MSELSAKIAALKAGRKTTEVLKLLRGVSRNTFRRIERGESVKLSTLREVATGFKLEDDEWLELLIAWLRTEAGYDAERLWIESKVTGPSELRDTESDQVARAMMCFKNLTHADRQEITKAMQRPEVRNCLPAINKVWEKFNRSKISSANSPSQAQVEKQIVEAVRQGDPPPRKTE